MKNVEIIRLLLEKHPDGVPELYVSIVKPATRPLIVVPLQDCRTIGTKALLFLSLQV